MSSNLHLTVLRRWRSRTIVELKNELKIKGLPVAGTKSVLVQRLKDAMVSGTGCAWCVYAGHGGFVGSLFHATLYDASV